MDAKPVPISPNDLYRHLGTAVAPLLFDGCRADAFRADELIVGVVPRPPAGAPAASKKACCIAPNFAGGPRLGISYRPARLQRN
jgi:hypothetical protein